MYFHMDLSIIFTLGTTTVRKANQGINLRKRSHIFCPKDDLVIREIRGCQLLQVILERPK